MSAEPGDILLLQFRHLDIAHRKYCILLSTNPKLQFFLINTKINDLGLTGDSLAERRGHFLGLKRNPNYTFFNHDSWLDCSDPHGYGTIEELDNTIAQDATSSCGCLVDDDKASMISIVRNSRLIPDVKKSWILNAFGESL